MIAYLISGLSFLLALMLQYGIVARTNLLAGSAEMVLLFIAAWSLHQHSKYAWILVFVFGLVVGFISAMPLLIPVIIYMIIHLVATFLRGRMWKTPLLAMFLLVFGGTLLEYFANVGWLFISGVSFSLSESFTNIALPSVLLNMLLAIPIHALVQEINRSISPIGQEE